MEKKSYLQKTVKKLIGQKMSRLQLFHEKRKEEEEKENLKLKNERNRNKKENKKEKNKQRKSKIKNIKQVFVNTTNNIFLEI